MRDLREQIEQTKAEIEQAERGSTTSTRPPSCKYGKLPELEKTAEGRRGSARGEAGRQQSLIKEEVDEEDIAEVVSRWTGIPVSKLLEGEMQKLLHLGEELHQRVIGQDEAVTAVAEAVIRARSGLKDPNRPIGSFIFLGPTGVGKTELARALAEFLFDDEQAMIRIDMSEYQEKHTVVATGRRAAGLHRLRGRRPAHRSGAPPAVLRDAVRRDREGAPRRVQRAAADARRRPADRRPGPHGRFQEHDRHHDVEHRQPAHPAVPGTFVGEVYDRMKTAVLDEMRKHFRPEFLNRVDEIIVFHALSEEHLKQIVDDPAGPSARSGWRSATSRWNVTDRRRNIWCASATIRPTAPGR